MNLLKSKTGESGGFKSIWIAIALLICYLQKKLRAEEQFCDDKKLKSNDKYQGYFCTELILKDL